MHPVLWSIPGPLVRVAVALLALYALTSLALLARKTAAPSFALRSPVSALMALLAALAIARYRAPVSAFSQLFSLPAWTSPWSALPLQSYGTMLSLSLTVAWFVTLSLAVREGIERERAVDLFVASAATAVLGSRVLYVLTNLGEFVDTATGRFSFPAVLSLRTGGLVAYGGFLGGLFGAWVVCKRSDISLKKWADVAAPSIALGLALTRIGCFLYGCDFGAPLSPRAPSFLLRLGTFPRWSDDRGSSAWAQHTLDGFPYDRAGCIQRFAGDFHDGLCHLSARAEASAPVHPTQLYESAFGFSLVAATFVVARRRTFEGQVILSLAALYGVGRALIEVLRGDLGRGAVASVSTSQWIGLGSALVCAALYARWKKRGAAAGPMTILALKKQS